MPACNCVCARGVLQIRYNEHDRSPIAYMSVRDADEFYTHLAAVTDVMRRKALCFETLLEEVRGRASSFLYRASERGERARVSE